MLGLGRPCALHALCPGVLAAAAAACRSLALGEASSCSLPGARALVGLQVEPSTAGERRRRPLRPAERRCPLLPRCVRGGFPAGAAGSPSLPTTGRGSEPRLLALLLLLRKPAGDPRWMCAEVSLLRATGSDLPAASGERSSSLGARKGTDGSPANDHTDPSQKGGEKPNKTQQLKKVFKEYGGVAVAFHVGISLMSLGMFYLAVSSGVDMTAILFRLGFDEAVVQSKLAAGTSTFLLAYAIHKLFAPVRISITLISVPLLVRYFRKIGFFKPPAPNP